jgi:hypothetical protein
LRENMDGYWKNYGRLGERMWVKASGFPAPKRMNLT